MVKRLFEIHPGPFRLLFVCSIITAVIFVIIALNTFLAGKLIINHEIIAGQTVEKVVGRKDFGLARIPLSIIIAISSFIFFWFIVRIILWISDGFKQHN